MKLTMTVAAALMVAAAAGVCADWPCYLGPDQTSVSSETGLMRTWPEGGPKVLWMTAVGEGFAGPIVIGGEVYLLDRGGPDGKEQDIFRCLSLADGAEKWHVAYDAPGKLSFNGSRSAGAADDKNVYTVGPFGDLVCFSRQGKSIVWRKNILKEYDAKLPGWGVAQSPVLYKDTLIVSPLGAKAGLVAFNRADGKEVWASKPIGKMEYVSPTLTTIGGVDQVLIIYSGGKTAGVAAADGKVLWTYEGWHCGIPITPPAHVGEGKVFITGGYKAGSAMIEVVKDGSGAFTAKELYKTQECGAQIHRPILYKGYLYLNSNDNQRADGMLCMDLAGKVAWKTKRTPNFERGGMLLADGLIFNLDGAKGFLYLIEPTEKEFKVIASAKVLETDTAWCPLALSDGKLLVRDKATLKCLDVKGGGAARP